MALGSILLFVILLFSLNYNAGWDWESLTYLDFWTMGGMLRHLFFNGFHPVFPWIAFLFVGMWLGRQNLAEPAFRSCLLISCTSVLLLSESLSWLLTQIVTFLAPGGAQLLDALALVDSQPIPPMPFYLFSAGSVAIIVILLSISLTQKYADSSWIKALVSTGQLALTLYVAHVIVGMGLLESLGRLENQSLEFAVLSALFFYAASVLFSAYWRRHFKRGPLEWIMRRVA